MSRIYVADLAAYNAGHLHGRWYDPADYDYDADTLQGAVNQLLSTGQKLYGDDTMSVHEEYAIHDYDDFYGLKIGEYDSLERVCVLAKALDDTLAGYGDNQAEAFALFVDNFGIDTNTADDISEAVDQFSDAYIGEQTALDYAYEYIESTGMMDNVNDTVSQYFDYESFARDLKLGGDVVELRGHLFYGNW